MSKLDEIRAKAAASGSLEDVFLKITDEAGVETPQ